MVEKQWTQSKLGGNMSITLIKKESIEGMEKLLIKYAENPDDPDTNFYLGVCYESLGHTAPGLSYFLRCAERTDDDFLAYEALIRGAYCYKKQGGRDWTAKTLFQHAMLTLPERPEAYFLLSRFCRERDQHQDAYILASQGLKFIDNADNKFRFDVEYDGEIGLLFEKAVSGWYWGKVNESVSILNQIYVSDDSTYRKKAKIALNEFNKWEGKISFNNFDWGDLPQEDIVTIDREIRVEDVYGCIKEVKENDIVVDIGASVGAFTYSILDNKPNKVYCIEPSKKALGCLLKNTFDKTLSYKNSPLICINKAIGNTEDSINIFGSESQFEVSTFSNIIEDYEIEKINYLKIDCEGGEYSIFTEENIDYIKENVDFIAAEFHLNYKGCREKFKYFRDNVLTKFTNYEVMSCTKQKISYGNSISLKDKIFDDQFIDDYTCEFMIYISMEK